MGREDGGDDGRYVAERNDREHPERAFVTEEPLSIGDYLREVRGLFAPPPRTFQRTVCRPGEICQFDVWQPREEVPVGHGQTR